MERICQSCGMPLTSEDMYKICTVPKKTEPSTPTTANGATKTANLLKNVQWKNS